MTQSNTSPKWFLIVSILALIWNMLGFMAFVSHVMMTPEMIAELPKAEQALYSNTPIWATAAFALAVVGGTLGCILLLLKKVLANTLFVGSLLGILLQNYYAFFVVDSFSALGSNSIIMPSLVILIAIALILLTSKAEQRQWIR